MLTKHHQTVCNVDRLVESTPPEGADKMPHEIYLTFQAAVVAAFTTVTGVTLQSNCECVGKSFRVSFKTTPLGWM